MTATSGPTAAQRHRMEAAEAKLLSHALSFPEARVDHPWGELVVKVGKKIFVFFGMADDPARFDLGLRLGVKLPESHEEALALPYAEPTGYGLGRAGWVSFCIPPATKAPLDLLGDWIDESYRAVATKTLVKRLDVERALPS